jgi:hypothetical protein
VSDLDRYGRWRVVPEYGSVWVPTAVAAGWVPYSTGSWTWDTYYGWTWIDTAPWGWAPFHYGRWVFVDSYWAWTPGPVVVRPAYAPALVAFFGGGPTVRVGWCPLGWGEPVIRWWGAPRFVGVAWWGGWGGPRVVNNVVINRTTVVNVQNINVYRNAGVRNALVVVDHQHFGRGPVASGRVAHADTRGLEVVRGRLDVKPVPGSFVPTTVRGVRPPDDRYARPVVATRPPERIEPGIVEGGHRGPAVGVAPSPRLVPAPRTPNAAVESPRAPIGEGRSERPQPPPPPRFGGQPRAPETGSPTPRQSGAPAARERRATETPRPQAPAPRVETPQPQTPPPRAESPRLQTPAPRVETPHPQAPVPRAESPRLQTPVPRVESPRPQTPAPSVESPRPQVAPRIEAPRPQPGQRLDVPRAQTRPLPGAAADRMSPGRGETGPQGRPEGVGERR